MSDAGLTINDTDQFLSHAVWLERRLFEIVGGCVASTSEPVAKLAFARQSRRHGWHAELLEPLRPDTRDHDPAVSAPLDPTWRTDVSRLLAATTTAQRAYHLAALLTRAMAGYEEHLARMLGFRDGSLMRVLWIIIDDEQAALADLAGFRAGI